MSTGVEHRMMQVAGQSIEFVSHDSPRSEIDRQFRSAFEHTNVAMVLTDTAHRFVRANAAFARLLGYTPQETLQLSLEDVTHPDDLAESYARREPLLSGESDFFQMEKRYLRKDGRILWALTNVALLRDACSRPLQYVGQVQDITARKELEDQLRHSQRMEGIGRLAGGVAHDFNNLLTVINGYSDLAAGSLSAGDPVQEMVSEIKNAGERAASLTRQLLAFSRKQVLRPVVIDLNDLVGNMQRMFSRLIGEDICLQLDLTPTLWQVKIDAGQMEQVIMNLIVNARDAMPQGGKLAITTANVEQDASSPNLLPDAALGQYVLLTVGDNGCGIDEATKSRIFEPFFTTKDPGKGTGLGLSTVWGIVQQSGGHIQVDTSVGQGTIFKIYLPKADKGAESPPLNAKRSNPLHGSETVLLVEDDERVRSLAHLILESYGYTVLAAQNGAAALLMAERHPGTIHLVLTDVVMPQMSGYELTEQLKAQRPELKAIYLSGYMDDTIVRHGVRDDAEHVLLKPFSPVTLAKKIREVLEGLMRND
jgi:PAS domain S-box-containing protein